MWIALNDGFLSAVQADMKRLPKAERKRNKGTGVLCVRARKAEHLAELFPGYHVYQWQHRDYPARIFIAREDFAKFVAKRAGSIDYGNFKDSVADEELHDAYMAVWSAMHRFGLGLYKRRPYEPLDQQSFDYPNVTTREQAEKMRMWQRTIERLRRRERPVEETCGMIGCTPENPCLDCITGALRVTADGENVDVVEDRMADRYGDFDDRDDVDAQSHLRVPRQ